MMDKKYQKIYPKWLDRVWALRDMGIDGKDLVEDPFWPQPIKKLRSLAYRVLEMTTYRFFHTALLSVPAILGFSQAYHREEPWSFCALSLGFLSGGAALDVRQHQLRKRMVEEYSLLPKHMKALPPTYLDKLGASIAREHGIHAQLSSYETGVLDSSGTGLSKGGYLITANFTYRDGQQRRAVIKTGLQFRHHFGKRFDRTLADMFDFVPNQYLVGKINVITHGRKVSLYGDTREGAPRGEPTAYEYVNGKSLDSLIDSASIFLPEERADNIPAEAIFAELMKLYGKRHDEIIETDFRLWGNCICPYILNSYAFYEDKLASLGVSCNNPFNRAYQSLFESVHVGTEDRILGVKGPHLWPEAYVHGDPNPSNIFLTDEGVKIIDWDNAHVANPYSDFMWFCVVADLETLPSFESRRQRFLSKLEELELRPSELQQAMIEHECYMRLAANYICSALIKRRVSQEFVPNMLIGSRYLLTKAFSSLDKVAELSNRPQLVDDFLNLVDNHPYLNQVAQQDYCPNASVAYLHRVNCEFTTMEIIRIQEKNLEHDVRRLAKLYLPFSSSVASSRAFYQVMVGGGLSVAGVAACAGLVFPEFTSSDLYSIPIIVGLFSAINGVITRT